MKKYIKWIIKFVFTISLFILIFYPKFFGIEKQIIPVTLESLWQEITGVDLSVFWKWILVAMVIKAFGMLSSMIRWDLLLRGQGIKLPFSHLAGTFLVGRFFGMFLPSTIGLDGYRLYDVAKHTGKAIESTTVILIEKLIGFIALTFLVFLTLPLGMRFLKFNLVVLTCILMVLAVFIFLSFLFLFNPRVIQILITIVPIPRRQKIQEKLDHIARAVTAYSGQKALLAKALVWGFLVHLCTALMYFGTAMSIKTANIDILNILFASPVMIYGTVLGPSIGGEGIREIVFALILGKMAGHAKAVLFAHLGFWVGETLSLAGGIIYMVRPAEYRPHTEEIKEVLKTTDQKLTKAAISPQEIKTMKDNIKGRIAAGVWMGLWAGFIVGLVEGIVIIFSFPNLTEVTVFYFGPIAYALFCGTLGLGFGIFLSILALFKHTEDRKERIWGVCFAFIFIPVGLTIARFRIFRDILHEKPLTIIQNLLLLGTSVLLLIILYWIVKKMYQSNLCRFFLKSYGASGIWAVVLLGIFFYCKITAPNESKIDIHGTQSILKPNPNVILIMVDALRAGHLSCYGYSKNQTPHIDSLARDGICFTQLFAQSSWTKPQSATLLTSLYPSTHNTYLKPHILPDEIETLAESMKKLGYTTGGVVSNINLSPIFNFNQGFDYYCYLSPDYFFYAKESSSKLCLYNMLRLLRERFLVRGKNVHHYYQPGSVVNSRVLAWLKKVKNLSFFLFVHYMDPHDPYFAHPYNGEAVARVSTPNPHPQETERIKTLYDEEISYLDKNIGALINYLKENKLYDECLIILTADHGEEFYDHGGWWHGTTLFEEVVHIPLIIKLPYNKNSQTIETRLVRSLDIAPTIIDIAGGAPPEAMQGTSLFLHSQDNNTSPVYAEEDHENNVIQSLRTDHWKLILTKQGSPRMNAPVQLFNMEDDPGEKRNLASNFPDLVENMKQQLSQIANIAKHHAYSAHKKQIDESTRERLKALGYVQ